VCCVSFDRRVILCDMCVFWVVSYCSTTAILNSRYGLDGPASITGKARFSLCSIVWLCPLNFIRKDEQKFSGSSIAYYVVFC
jgi:hypothetical protein